MRFLAFARLALFTVALTAVTLVASPAAAFPTVAATATTAGSATATTSHVLTLPSGVTAGDCLIVTLAGDTAGFTRTNTWPGSWVELVDAQNATARAILTVGFLRASGGETSVTVTSSGTYRAAAVAYRISGCHASTTPEAATPSSGTTGSPNPPSLNPANWDSEENLWIIAVGSESVTGPFGCPTNYGNELYVQDLAPAGSCTSCRRALAAASDDPDAAMTNAGVSWVATTIAVRPAAATGGGCIIGGGFMGPGCIGSLPPVGWYAAQ